MDELIRRGDLLKPDKNSDRILIIGGGSGRGKMLAMMETLMKQKIEAAPAVAAVEVVRCKDCKHGDNHCDKRGFCTYCNIRGKYPVRMNQDDFCSNGERKDHETN